MKRDYRVAFGGASLLLAALLVCGVFRRLRPGVERPEAADAAAGDRYAAAAAGRHADPDGGAGAATADHGGHEHRHRRAGAPARRPVDGERGDGHAVRRAVGADSGDGEGRELARRLADVGVVGAGLDDGLVPARRRQLRLQRVRVHAGARRDVADAQRGRRGEVDRRQPVEPDGQRDDRRPGDIRGPGFDGQRGLSDAGGHASASSRTAACRSST